MTTTKLKIIACVAMLIDHIGYIFFPEYVVLRLIGRIAFPIFAFLIAEGYCHTKHVGAYLLRLFLFALLSEIPFDLAFSGHIINFNYQNIFFTLLLGLLVIVVYDKLFRTKPIIAIPIMLGIAAAAVFLKTDYDILGIVMIFTFYIFRNRFALKASAMTAANAGYIAMHLSSPLQILSALALPFIYAYNGKKGRSIKYFFYLFYPGHLLLLYWIYIAV